MNMKKKLLLLALLIGPFTPAFAAWDVTVPLGTESKSLGDNRMREFKSDVQAAFQYEGDFPGDAASPHFIYTPSSGTTTNRPTGINAPPGRIYINTSSGCVEMNNGSTSTVNWQCIAPLTTWSNLTSIWNYQKPTMFLTASLGTNICLSSNTTVSNTVGVLFPDGEYRSESYSDSNAFLCAEKTNQAVFGPSAATVQSGWHLSTAPVNSWGRAYAVKVTSSPYVSKFAIVISTIDAIHANVNMLNVYFSTNGWVPLGLVRHGDQAGNPVSILGFKQSGSSFALRNTNTTPTRATVGIRLAGGAGAASQTWTYTSGMSGTAVPPSVTIGDLWGSMESVAGAVETFRDSSGAVTYMACNASTVCTALRSNADLTQGGLTTTGGAIGQDIMLQGWKDDAIASPFGLIR